ncbi:unnamed protein product [Rotaria sordida]|uniref:Uncharacterized protein n=1 Tax=Rotaria sordida TaxID=392033 RepID=A0A813ZXC3_9BILA|nr:unnamed protein product [Rotaria sordida]CAF0875497.1 unnamed protein product [Rotaria sordida]CAF0905474.1 unnamed protein product [Rotaria sordida]CAF3503320.1 unnamed protein product [Rotaria sordida]CAF3942544.1 unnamed protein product [Rotaria sordida]
MSTWRKRFSRKSQRLTENDEILFNNTAKYRRKLQSAITQISRTKKSVQRNFDSPASEIHVARLINDIGQLSDCKPLQEITGLIDSLAMRHQLSSRIFNEYAMNSLQQSLRKLNDNLSNDYDKTKSIFEEAITNHCSDHTKNQLLTKIQTEWSKHQKLATKELKQGLSSYCDIGLYNLKVQIAILEKLRNFVDQLPRDDNDTNNGLPNFAANNIQTRREIDTMLRVMLDAAPNDSASLPGIKRPKFLNNNLILSNTLYSPEISEAAACSNLSTIGQRNTPIIPQYPSMIVSTTETNRQIPQYDSAMNTPLATHNGRFQITPTDDSLPSYTDLFVVPGNCKEDFIQRRNTYIKK